MPETLFIADVHLAPNRPIPLNYFKEFLTNRVQQAEALYILGDLFEVWLGDDQDEPIYKTIQTALRKVKCPVFIMHGNRDFLIGKDFAETTGCKLIKEPYLIDLYGTPTLLMHGDTLCTEDKDYQAFRQQVRHPEWQRQFLAQPLAQRRILAQQARAQSQAKTQSTAEYIMDVTPEAVVSTLKTHQVKQLIHGHTHRPAQHKLTINGQIAYRQVLGDWRDNSAMILSCTPEGCELIDLI